MITLDSLNKFPEKDAFKNLEQCCVSKTWITNMLKSRPFTSEKELISKAADIWFEECETADYLEAFTGHPKIGDVESLKKKFANTKEWAENEQASMSDADLITINRLARANAKYEEKFGYIFIVSASGKSAMEMLAIINARLHHSKADEIHLALNEQHKITVIRLAKLIEGLKKSCFLKSHVTTHALDTSIGKPASGMIILLKGFKDNEWRPIGLGVTNDDGRISDVLPSGRNLAPDIYQMVFRTENYFKKNATEAFYPEVSVQFKVSNNKHYHIPLLINPFGYSTYKGS